MITSRSPRAVKPLVWGLIVTVALAALAIWAYHSSQPSRTDSRVIEVAGYTVSSDERSIILSVVIGAGDVIGTPVVHQTADAITIDIPVSEHLGPKPAVGLSSDITVPLDEPFNNRTVLNWDGTEIRASS